MSPVCIVQSVEPIFLSSDFIVLIDSYSFQFFTLNIFCDEKSICLLIFFLALTKNLIVLD